LGDGSVRHCEKIVHRYKYLIMNGYRVFEVFESTNKKNTVNSNTGRGITYS